MNNDAFKAQKRFYLITDDQPECVTNAKEQKVSRPAAGEDLVSHSSSKLMASVGQLSAAS
jgi:hypothetical protein